jgi:hypothetical protein
MILAYEKGKGVLWGDSERISQRPEEKQLFLTCWFWQYWGLNSELHTYSAALFFV